MMPAVQIGSGPGMAAAARGSSVGSGLGSAAGLGTEPGNGAGQGDPSGTGFGAVMAHAISAAAGTGQGVTESSREPVAGASGAAAGSASAGAAAVGSKNVTDMVTNAKPEGGSPPAELPGVPAQSDTAATAKTVEALTGLAQTAVQPMAATAGQKVTDIGTNVGGTVSAGVEVSGTRAGDSAGNATGKTSGPAPGATGAASAHAGRKADGKKTEDKSQPAPPQGLMANGAVMLAAAASAVAGVNVSAVPVGAMAGATVVSGKAVLIASGAGKHAAEGAAGIANELKNAQGAAAGQSQSQSRGRTQGNLVAAVGGAGSVTGSAPMAVGADTGAGANVSSSPSPGASFSVDASGLPRGNAVGGTGLMAGHARDGGKNAGGANGNGNASLGGGFTATLLQAHAGNGLANGLVAGPGIGPGVSAGVAAGPGAAAGPRGVLQHAAGGAGGVGAANPYARMDEPQRATLVYASPQKMSVAVSDPGLGNFQVRAQGAGAQVAASLATTSAVTHAQLSGHLPALTAFLQDQRVDVSRVTVVQQSLLGADAGPRDFGGHQQQGSSGGRGARTQAGRVGGVEAGRAGGSQGVVSSAGPAGAEAGLDLGRDDAVGASMRRTAAVDGGAMRSVDVHA